MGGLAAGRGTGDRMAECCGHEVSPFWSSIRSKKPTMRRSYSAGSVVIPAMCCPFGTSQICFGSPAAA